ncbi:hypothetical protein TREMEDRAFT_66504 [Tremella mesenterica DSM 1558]|uniref:uncharacterized protein n=1 Tax=Tremella mesenterica (strain ATCC 24925 / CBS 8224 / DSM 1558 / NBRC 9311 / NRRL Y-6157 / RJB 2259-6 / UBC 559-6) TaxID=578456 RepID=UPI00032C07EB|nr:uncharacterized protein TREMEDRAFT_66504 [Tremella mesenterica DSM 1558]EIW65513.1 hypothetical protein TREMEDRAFT_66504 [Tremella mesenterica DSM 1558]
MTVGIVLEGPLRVTGALLIRRRTLRKGTQAHNLPNVEDMRKWQQGTNVRVTSSTIADSSNLTIDHKLLLSFVLSSAMWALIAAECRAWYVVLRNRRWDTFNLIQSKYTLCERFCAKLLLLPIGRIFCLFQPLSLNFAPGNYILVFSSSPPCAPATGKIRLEIASIVAE